MDTALKHRLTGAVILVLLAVLLLPELLTGSGHAAKTRPAATGEGGEVERQFEVDLTESASVPAAPLPQANPTPPVELPVPAVTSAPVAATPPAAATAPAPAVTPPPAAAPSIPAEAVRAEAAKPTAEATRAPAAKSAPAAKAAPEPKPAPEAKPNGGYYVQLGVFANPSSARRLERKLRDKKFAVVIDEVARSGKTMLRVRVGPEADRAAANALAKKLADAGYKGSVVK